MNFGKITVDSETKGTVIMTPNRFFIISDNDVKYVVMYNLKFVNIGEEIEANIPYYLSNGATNKLRANMLYPFMCYSSINEVSTCPYDTYRRTRGNPYTSVLLKYNSPGNINIDKLEEDLLNTFLGIYSESVEETSKIESKIRNKRQQGNDLISVLQRITNLLDFIICITNDSIREFNYLTERTDIDNGKYRPLSHEQKETNDYTDLSIFGQETKYNVSESQIDDSSSPFNNHFRLVILTILNKYYKLFVDNNIIDIETMKLEPEIITVEMFNRIVNICDKKTAKLNMTNYKVISNQIIDVISEKIDINDIITEQAKILLKSIIKQTTTTLTNDDDIYNQLLSNWKVQCLSKKITINTKNINKMDVLEICQELSTYSDYVSKNFTKIYDEINQICANVESNPNMALKILREKLLMIRSQMILYNYVGQLIIKYKVSNGTEKTIKVDIDSSETISTLKSEIYNIEGIDPAKQHIMIHNSSGNIIHLENDRTIASYNIPNNSTLKLSISAS